VRVQKKEMIVVYLESVNTSVSSFLFLATPARACVYILLLALESTSMLHVRR
jgi:hypothetical protein